MCWQESRLRWSREWPRYVGSRSDCTQLQGIPKRLVLPRARDDDLTAKLASPIARNEQKGNTWYIGHSYWRTGILWSETWRSGRIYGVDREVFGEYYCSGERYSDYRESSGFWDVGQQVWISGTSWGAEADGRLQGRDRCRACQGGVDTCPIVQFSGLVEEWMHDQRGNRQRVWRFLCPNVFWWLRSLGRGLIQSGLGHVCFTTLSSGLARLIVVDFTSFCCLLQSLLALWQYCTLVNAMNLLFCQVVEFFCLQTLLFRNIVACYSSWSVFPFCLGLWRHIRRFRAICLFRLLHYLALKCCRMCSGCSTVCASGP